MLITSRTKENLRSNDHHLDMSNIQGSNSQLATTKRQKSDLPKVL